MTPALSLPYHQPAFLHLTKIFEKRIRHELVQRFATLRGELFLKTFPIEQVIENQKAWDLAKGVLDAIDAEMQALISRRSVAYWLHLYRRIGVFLSPHHEDKTDHVTLGLVRQIAELAIQKHGLRSGEKEFGRSDALGPDLILGGWMKKGLKSLGRKDLSGEKIYREYCRHLRNVSNWVIRDFSKKDLFDIYAIEGAAYQYWRITALLRALGKGARIRIDRSGDWHYSPDCELSELLESIDKRNESRSSFSSLMGIWIDNDTIVGGKSERTDDLDVVFFPVYNTTRAEISSEFELLGIRFAENAVTNFFPLYMRAKPFFDSHAFMRDEFSKKRGYDFELLISVLVGLSSFLFLPDRALYAANEKERDHIKSSALMQTLTRGYHLFVGDEETLLKTLLERMSLVFTKDFDREAVQGVLTSITLNEGVQKKISPWSNGPRSVVIPAEGVNMIDLASVPALLRSIFAFMADRLGTSGTIFERLFREALERRGYRVFSGKLVAHDGSERELDAGVCIGDQMYIFECVSIERPLDYEIGKPRTMAVRKDRLAQKIEQAASFKEFIVRNPSGRNYDLSSSKDFVWTVVSPFVEWIWDKSSAMWLDQKYPRILSPEEAFSLLARRDSHLD